MNMGEYSTAYHANISSALEKSTEAFIEAAENPNEFAAEIERDIDVEALINAFSVIAGDVKTIIERGFRTETYMDSATTAANHDPKAGKTVRDVKEMFGTSIDVDMSELTQLVNLEREARKELVVGLAVELQELSVESETNIQAGFGEGIEQTLTSDGAAMSVIGELSDEQHAAAMYQIKKCLESMKETYTDPRFEKHNNTSPVTD